ncbi:MAG: MopE-related protein [Candidatus Kerfeldbacteria bacterium]|nr:MopE-related protein [Candidatus Kerfeldbacteria bacterium]
MSKSSSFFFVVCGLLSLTACTEPVQVPDQEGDISMEVSFGEGCEALFCVAPSTTIPFGDVQVNTTAEQSAVVTYNGAEVTSVAIETTDNSVWSIRSQAKETLAPGYSFVVEVGFLPTEALDYAGGVTLTTPDFRGAFAVNGTGFVPEPEETGVNPVDDDGDGLTEDDGDCNDGDTAIHPDATEACDGLDNNCDGTVDEGCYDADGDGYDAVVYGGSDCDDANASVNPGATDLCDGLDNNCDGVDNGCAPPGATDDDGDGLTEDEGDCNDGDTAVYPGAPEVCGDGIDQNCDGADDLCPDDDGDGYTTAAGDCDDASAGINPGATEACDNGIDDDCDGLADDADSGCHLPDTGGGDTGDGETGEEDTGGETADSGGDTAPVDADGDGYTADTDCDDSDATVYPGATEACGDGIDQDCNGLDEACDTDLDDDGYDAVGYGGPDCDDTNAAIHPNAEEICDGVDNNCDGDTDDISLEFSFSSPDTGPQPLDGLTVYGYGDRGTWGCIGSSGPINLSICTDDSSVYMFTDPAEVADSKAVLQEEVNLWVVSAPMVDSEGVSYALVEWVDPTETDDEVCIFVGVEIAP